MIRILIELTKLRIAAFSTLSAATGYVVFSRSLHWQIIATSLGVLLLAMGACALNEWQDRDVDALMERTRRRPIPAGRIRPPAALAVAAALLACGFPLLSTVHGSAPALLGLLAVFWYNGVYTHLKCVSAFAVVPGALIGALPPAMGWTAAGGHVLDPAMLALCFFFFIWQVPHFWLLLFAFGSDYEKAGLPSLTRFFTTDQLSRITFLWTLVAAGSSLLLRIYGVTFSPYVSLGLIAAGLWLAWRASPLVRGHACNNRSALRSAFGGINAYALLVMGLLAADALLGVE